MIFNASKTESSKGTSPVRYVVVIRDGGEGRVLTLAPWHLRHTVEHEKRLGGFILGEYSDSHIAERALKQSLRRLKESMDTT
jgi:hypothetical protein